MTDDKRRVHIYIKRLAAAEKERDRFKSELTREREISAMLMAALEKIKDYETQTIYGYSGDEQLAIDDAWSRTADVAKEALAREKEMRK